MQPVPADHLGVCHSLRGQAITLIVGVPAQLHIPHERVLPHRGVLMLARAGITHARACPSDCLKDAASRWRACLQLSGLRIL